MAEPDWVDVGSVDELRTSSLQQVTVRKTKIALSYQDDEFCAISNACNHVGGPLGEGTLVGRAVDMARLLVAGHVPERRLPRGGRKAHELDVKAQT